MLNCSFCGKEKSKNVKLIENTDAGGKHAICFDCSIICKKLIEESKDSKIINFRK